MNCRDIEPLIYLVRDGELTEKEREQIARHMAICTDCKRIYNSTLEMTKLVGQASYETATSGDKEAQAEEIIQTINQLKKDRQKHIFRSHLMPVIKGIAASFLILIASSLIYQEMDFQRRRSSMLIPSEQSAGNSAFDARESDCLKMLKKRYKVSSFSMFPKNESLVINRISNEELTQYIEQVCGTNAEDVSKLKKALLKAGLIKTDQFN